EAEEPELEVDGERWDAGPCMYASPTDGTVEGRVRRLGTHSIGGFFPEADVFAVEDESGRELARLLMSPFGGPAIPFLTGARQIAVGPAVFISGADSIRLRELEGARARVRVGGRFVPGLTERNVVAELRGQSEEAIVVSAHYDSVWRGPGVVDNATGVAGERGLAERYELNVGPAGPGVDAYPFHEKGIPAATVSHFGYDEYHLPTERLELIDEQRLGDSVELATLLIESLLEQPVQPG